MPIEQPAGGASDPLRADVFAEHVWDDVAERLHVLVEDVTDDVAVVVELFERGQWDMTTHVPAPGAVVVDRDANPSAELTL